MVQGRTGQEGRTPTVMGAPMRARCGEGVTPAGPIRREALCGDPDLIPLGRANFETWSPGV